MKNDIKLYQGSLADRLDVLVKACNQNQTIGIPIGPESSRIIAEVISSRIDSDFQDRVDYVSRDNVDRLQDDWLVGVPTLERAEAVLSIITSIYRNYGLEINGNKTSIDRIIAHSETAWVSEIGAFLSHRSGPIRGSRLKELLLLSVRLQSTFPHEPVINYTLSIVEQQDVGLQDVEVVESFLLKAAVLSPSSMDRICRIILNLQDETKQVSRRRIGERFTQLAARNLENGNLYEVIWLVYTLRGLKFPLHSRRISELIEETASSALALILLDMKIKNLCVCNLPTTTWVSKITKGSVGSSWIWLLGYEGIRHGWLSDPSNVMAGSLFQPMASRGVVFYDPRKNVLRSSKVVRLRNLSRRRNLIEMRKLIRRLRGFSVTDY